MNITHPILMFKNEVDFQNCCRWWQHTLFLDDWFIKFKMVDSIEREGFEQGQLEGECSFNQENKSATIQIVNLSNIKNIYFEETNSFSPVELVIVHELLHLKNEYYNTTCICGEPDPQIAYLTHQWMEQMAKSLLIAKYNLDYNYFMGEDFLEEQQTKTQDKTDN